MKDQILARLGRVEPRLIAAVLAAVFALIALECWVLLLRAPLAKFRHLNSAVTVIQRPVAEPRGIQADIGRLQRRLATLTRALQRRDAPVPGGDLANFLLGRLAAIAEHRGVHLRSMRPGPTKRILMFDEISSDIEVTGPYRALFGWLRDTERELRPIAVTQFSIKVADITSGALTMDLKLAAYRPAAAETPKR